MHIQRKVKADKRCSGLFKELAILPAGKDPQAQLRPLLFSTNARRSRLFPVGKPDSGAFGILEPAQWAASACCIADHRQSIKRKDDLTLWRALRRTRLKTKSSEDV